LEVIYNSPSIGRIPNSTRFCFCNTGLALLTLALPEADSHAFPDLCGIGIVPEVPSLTEQSGESIGIDPANMHTPVLPDRQLGHSMLELAPAKLAWGNNGKTLSIEELRRGREE
jgi:hypothetical protein